MSLSGFIDTDIHLEHARPLFCISSFTNTYISLKSFDIATLLIHRLPLITTRTVSLLLSPCFQTETAPTLYHKLYNILTSLLRVYVFVSAPCQFEGFIELSLVSHVQSEFSPLTPVNDYVRLQVVIRRFSRLSQLSWHRWVTVFLLLAVEVCTFQYGGIL